MKNTQLRPVLALLLLTASACAAAASVQVTVIDREGKPVADAVVVVSVPGRTLAAGQKGLAKEQTIINEKSAYVPALSIVGVGAKLKFSNLDPYDHHVRGTAAGAAQFSAGAGGGFELRMDAKTDGKPVKVQEVTADKAGAILLGCHLHSAMRGHVYVTDSPWAARTDANGSVRFDDLPEAGAQVRVWQADQLIDLPAQTMSFSAVNTQAQPTKLEFKLQVVPRRRRS